MAEKKKWERLEEWLFDHDTEQFTNGTLAHSLGIARREATYMIQEYLRVQRHPDSSALYVLKRVGRTKAAIWSVGARTEDAKIIANTLYGDIKTKVMRAFVPDLEQLSRRNPRAARYAEAKIEGIVDGALKVLAGALDVADE